ncbi:TPA: DNA methyltransferase, partial [Escherichia coli]
GSGSTLRAAAELNRNAYGFEIKKEMYEASQEKMLSNIPMGLFI